MTPLANSISAHLSAPHTRLNRSVLAIVFLRWRADCARKYLRVQGDGIGHTSARTPLIVITLERGARIVCACCAQASRRGIHEGMALAHARALCPPPRIEVDAQPEREAATVRAVARWCQRYAPIVAIEPTDGPTAILVDITGCERVHQSHEQLTQRVVEELSKRGFAVRVAIAPTAAAAVALAQSGARELSACPLGVLRIAPQAVAALADVQVRTIGELARLPRASVTVRYGSEVLHRFDQALGEAIEIVTPIRSQPPPSVEQIFDGPVTSHDAIARTVARLFEELCASLRALVRGGREFELTALCADAPMYRHRMMLAAPSARAEHLAKLFAPHLEKIPVGMLGMGIESLRIAVLRMGSCAAQSERSGTVGDRLSEWSDTLRAQLGDHALFRGGFAEHHQPLRSIRWIAIARCGLSPRIALRHARVRAASAWRPSTWITPPEPLAVAAAHASMIRWRGSAIAIATWHGPERIASPWEMSAASPTAVSNRSASPTGAPKPVCVDYWRVETTQGAWLWIAQDARGWSLVGIWS